MSGDVLRSVALLLTQEAFRQNRGWDYQGVWANVKRALDEDGRTARQVVTAGYSAIDDPKAQTPAAIRWAARYVAPGSPHEARAPRCKTCQRTQPVCEATEAKAPPDTRHAFEAER